MFPLDSSINSNVFDFSKSYIGFISDSEHRITQPSLPSYQTNMGNIISAVEDIIHFATSIGADLAGALNNIPKIVPPVPPTDVGAGNPVTTINLHLQNCCEAGFKNQFGYSYMAESTASGDTIIRKDHAALGVKLLDASMPDWSSFQNSLNVLVKGYNVGDPSEFSTRMYTYVQAMYNGVENYQSMMSSVYEKNASQIDYAIAFVVGMGHDNANALFVYFIFAESQAWGLVNGGTPALNSICPRMYRSLKRIASVLDAQVFIVINNRFYRISHTLIRCINTTDSFK